jgi:hypothetical protein
MPSLLLHKLLGELYHFEARALLMRRGDGRALTAAASAQRALAAAQKVYE